MVQVLGKYMIIRYLEPSGYCYGDQEHGGPHLFLEALSAQAYGLKFLRCSGMLHDASWQHR